MSKGDFWDNPFGGMFDFNGDGKEDLGEQWIAHKIFEDCMKDENDSDDSFLDDSDYSFDSEDKYAWRNTCEDGYMYNVYPEDYDTEEEYMEALEEEKYAWRDTCEDGSEYGVSSVEYDTEEEYITALEEKKYAWRDTCEDGFEYDISPEDYETEEEYMEALEDAKEGYHEIFESDSTRDIPPSCYETEEDDDTATESFINMRRFKAIQELAIDSYLDMRDEDERKELARCKFIKEKADTVLAADYLSHEDGFLYAMAIKDNFKLPISLPDEDESREMEFYEIIRKIAKKDIPLSFRVWRWTIEQFLPYTEYDEFALDDMTSDVIDSLYTFPQEYPSELVRYMEEHPDFCRKISEGSTKDIDDYSELVALAISEELHSTADTIFKTCLQLAGDRWKKINTLTEMTILYCKNYEELESMEYFRDHLFPIVKDIKLGMVQDEIEDWEDKISEYIESVETSSEKYAYSRIYAWRSSVSDVDKQAENPTLYETEQEYYDALNYKRYGWRRLYEASDTYGVNPKDFETHKEFRKAVDEACRKIKEQSRTDYQKSSNILEDRSVYTLCGVVFDGNSQPYYYRTEDETIKVGDTVLVPAGNNEAEAIVVSVGQYMKLAAPFPIEKTKFIIRKITEESE